MNARADTSSDTSSATPFDRAVDILTKDQPLRVWSILVSIFGDLARKPGDLVSGAALTRIVAPLGIRPEAMRVALHRLRRDGWIESRRAGRGSSHGLSENGRSQSQSAAPRIYDRQRPLADDWHIAISRLPDSAPPENAVKLARGVYLARGPIAANNSDAMLLELAGRQVPEWIRAHVCPDDLISTCADLRRDLDLLASLQPIPADPFQIATLRTLIVHRWRRIALRHDDLPADFFPPDWCGPQCRAQVADLLAMLPPPTLADLNSTGRPQGAVA